MNTFHFSNALSLCFLILMTCQVKSSQEFTSKDTTDTSENKPKTSMNSIEQTIAESTAVGSVGNGKLINGVKLPYKGKNFKYFSRISYLAGRAYIHSRVREVILESYKTLEKSCPNRIFYLMEGAYKNGGPLPPHRTHQNGLSIDFMSLMQKAKEPYTKLDQLGATHYGLEFDKDGRWLKDSSIEIDFEVMGKHIQSLERACQNHQMRIAKIILKIDLKDELLATNSGSQLKHLPFVGWLPDQINRQHDDHYHIDFELLD